MHLFLSAEESGVHLLEELRRQAPEARHQTVIHEPDPAIREVVDPRVVPTAKIPHDMWERRRPVPARDRRPADTLLTTQMVLSDLDLPAAPPPVLAFVRQTLPGAVETQRESINAWADLIFQSVMEGLPETQPWMLHVIPRYGSGDAGLNRRQLILTAVRERLQKRRRQRLRQWVANDSPFSPQTSLVQLVLTAPNRGWLSVAAAPLPHQLRAIVSPFEAGDIPIAVDKAAPCRAFAKLVEALQRLGRSIQQGEACVDLGASPGSWTYVALRSGARVTAVDRAPLRDDLMRHPHLTFHRGDAFTFRPDHPVDWLLCDVIAAPARSIELVREWVSRRLARRFVVTIKFKGTEDYAALDDLRVALRPLCADFRLTRLCANRNEACVYGAVSETTT